MSFSPTSLTRVAAADPAGGAALDQVAIATGGAFLALGSLLWLIARHRARNAPRFERLVSQSERVSGLPGWAAIPTAVSAVALVTALLGMYWDIALHIDEGRDAGPLANPAHYLILAGLFGVFAAGVLAMAMPRSEPGAAAVSVGWGWRAPVGGGMRLIAQAVLLQEGIRSRPPRAGSPRHGLFARYAMLRQVALMGGLLIGLSTF